MQQLAWMTWIYNGFIFLSGLLLAIFMIVNNPTTDSVPVFDLANRIPGSDAFDISYNEDISAPIPYIVSNTSLLIQDVCMERVRGTSTKVLTSPLCKCLYDVLARFQGTFKKAANTKDKYALAGPAFTSCFYTQPQVPHYDLVASSQYDDSKISTRNVLNRSTFLIIIMTGYLINAIYNSLNFDGTHYFENNRYFLALLVIAIALQCALPLIGSSASSSNRVGIAVSLILLPSLLIQGALLEYFWSYITSHKRRTSFIHPYVFSTTLQSLFILALIDNGVLDFTSIATMILVAHALTFAYAGLLFYLFLGCIEPLPDNKGYNEYSSTATQERPTFTGYLLLILTMALVVVLLVQPHFPTVPEQNFMWLMPWIFVAIAVCIPTYIERSADKTSNPEYNQIHFLWTAQFGFYLYSFVVLGVLLYYLMRTWQYSFADKILASNANTMPTMNYGLALNPRIHTQYSVP